jgi:hypothetical protein
MKTANRLDKKEVARIKEAFAAVEKYDLKPSTIICTVCGTVIRVDRNKKEDLCEHLKELFRSIV